MNKPFLWRVATFVFIVTNLISLTKGSYAITFDEIVAYQKSGKVLSASTGPDVYYCQSNQTVSSGNYTYSTPNLDSYSDGQSITKNSLSSTNWENATSTISRNLRTTNSLSSYIVANNTSEYVLQTKICSRDMEVDTYTRYGWVILRRDPATGNGIYFSYNGNTTNGYFALAVMTSTGESSEEQGTSHLLYETSNLASLIPGYGNNTTPTDGAYFTFGVSGFDIYAKFNGTEFLRIKEYRQMAPGTAAFKSVSDTGYRTTTIRHLSNQSLYSDYSSNILDLRDFDVVSGHTTGSINSGSNQLTVASASNFSVGDHVIVEVGGESGGGLRGSVGVGGTWPTLSYASATQMNADSSKAANTFAYTRDNYNVYQYLSGTWELRDATYYYTNKAYPIALMAGITAVSGNTLTLDTSASTTATNANVYFDNYYIMEPLIDNPNRGGDNGDFTDITPSNLTINIPAGDYAIGQRLVMLLHTGWKFQGAGMELTKILSPKGALTANVLINQSDYSQVNDLTIQGNFAENGYGLGATQTDLPQNNTYLPGLQVTLTDYAEANNVKVIDAPTTFNVGLSNYIWGNNIQGVRTYPDRHYLSGWQLVWANSTGGGCRYCSVTSTYLIPGMEAFQSAGVSFINTTLVNAIVSMNSSGDFLIENTTLTITPNSQFDETSMSHWNPSVNINNNINSTQYNADPTINSLDQGGIIRNMNITETGYINSDNDIIRGIIINDQNPNVRVLGGSYIVPDYAAPSILFGGEAITTIAPNYLIDGFRAVGTINPAYPYGNINAAGSGTVQNCIADKVWVPDGYPVTVSNCMTNAEYLAYLASLGSGSSSGSSSSTSASTTSTSNTSTSYTQIPNILSFTASSSSITEGQSSTLSWIVNNATSLSINNGVGTVTGNSVKVYPSTSTIYTLSAKNSYGTSTKSVYVTVKSPNAFPVSVDYNPDPQVDLYPYVSNTLVNDSGTIYVIEGKIKHGFTTLTVFKKLGYQIKYVINGNTGNYEHSDYVLNTPNQEHPWGSWLNLKGTIYYATKEGLIPVPSFNIFTNNRGLTKYIVPMNKSDQQVLKTRRLQNMTLDDPRVTQE